MNDSPTCIAGAIAAQRIIDLIPCPRCGGDVLRADFSANRNCHVGGTA